MDTLWFAKVRDTAKIPTKRDEDGCYDIYPCLDGSIDIRPFSYQMIPTGIASAFDKKYRIGLRERGSNTKSFLKINAGQIDSGYRGEWFISVFNASDKFVRISDQYENYSSDDYNIYVPTSKAICQAALEFVPVVSVGEIPIEELQSIYSDRGTGKLGSSGK